MSPSFRTLNRFPYHLSKVQQRRGRPCDREHSCNAILILRKGTSLCSSPLLPALLVQLLYSERSPERSFTAACARVCVPILCNTRRLGKDTSRTLSNRNAGVLGAASPARARAPAGRGLPAPVWLGCAEPPRRGAGPRACPGGPSASPVWGSQPPRWGSSKRGNSRQSCDRNNIAKSMTWVCVVRPRRGRVNRRRPRSALMPASGRGGVAGCTPARRRTGKPSAGGWQESHRPGGTSGTRWPVLSSGAPFRARGAGQCAAARRPLLLPGFAPGVRSRGGRGEVPVLPRGPAHSAGRRGVGKSGTWGPRPAGSRKRHGAGPAGVSRHQGDLGTCAHCPQRPRGSPRGHGAQPPELARLLPPGVR